MSEDLAQLIADNRPLPECDIEEIPAGALNEPAGRRLASYLELAGALGRIAGAARLPGDDLFPAPPASARFSLALEETTQDASGASPIPAPAGITAILSGEAARSTLAAAIAAVDRAAGAQQQFEPVLRLPAAAEAISSPEELGANVAMFAAVDGSLRAGVTAQLGFDYHWLREVAAGALAGELGVAVDGALEAALELSLGGSFLACVTLDQARWLRLRVFRRTDANLDFAWNLAVRAEPRTPLPESPEPLALAVLGVHDGQWLEALAKLAHTDAKSLEASFGADVQRVLDLWNGLEARAAHAIWNAAGSNETLAGLRDWIHRISTTLRDQNAFQAALGEALENIPGFAGSPQGLWLEAAAGGLLAAVSGLEAFGRVLRSAEAADAILSEEGLAGTLGRLKNYAVEQLSLGRVRQALESLASFHSLDDWLQRQLESSLGAISNTGELGRAIQRVETAVGLARTIYAKVFTALQQKYSAELSYRYQRAEAGSALLDCSFNFTPEGLAAYRQAFGGDFTFLGAGSVDASHVRPHCATLTHSLSGQARIELHLPFFDRKQWTDRWDALAQVEIVAGPDGRILAYTVESSSSLEKQGESQSRLALAGGLLAGQEARFTLAYTDERKLAGSRARTALAGALAAYSFDERVDAWLAAAPGEDVEASLTLSVPGACMAAWFRAPGEREPEFLRVFSAVSVAVQRALRQWLPYVYFAELNRYDDLGAAFPLLVYQTMRPFVGSCRAELTYDVMSPATPEAAVVSAGRPLVGELGRVYSALTGAGKKDVARFYAPDQARSILGSVLRQPRLLNCLLAADAFFVDSLVHLGIEGRKLADTMPRDPGRAVKDLARFSADFVSAFHRRLRRLYGGDSFVAFGPLLLAEATSALGAARQETASMAATLRLRRGGAERTFVNAAFRP